jgi:hypothetical protein
MATLEIEGAEHGWLATVAAERSGGTTVTAAATPEIQQRLQALLQRLLEEPLDGRLLGERRGEDLLYGLADALGRRRPLLGAERVFGYVHGGSRLAAADPPVPGWDEP